MSNIFDSLLLTHIIADFQGGKTQEAFIKLDEYIDKYPKDLAAKYNFALMAEKINKTDLAIKNYKIVIKKDPNHWQSRNNLYLIFYHQKKYQDALKLANEVLNIKPDYQPVLRDKAHILYHQKKLDVALKLISKSIKLNPKDYIAINILGIIHAGLRDHSLAKKIYLHAIKVNNKYFPSYSNLAKSLTELNEREDAIKYLKICLELKPDFIEGINNLANVYSTMGKYDKAIPLYLKTLEKNKDHFQINLNLAIAYFKKKNLIEAEKYFKKAEAKETNDDTFKKNYGLFLLYTQDYKKAWELVDGRLKLQDFYLPGTWMTNIKAKLWSGNKIDINNKILVIKEQGVGDEILFSTIYPSLLKKYPNVKIETEKRLLSLFKKSYGFENSFIPFLSTSNSKKELKKYDNVIMAGTLGRLFRNSKESFPKINLIKSSTQTNTSIKIKLNKISNKKKIGIAWKSKREYYGEGKSLTLESLKPLILNDKFDFINLQYGETQEEILSFKRKYNKSIISIPDIDLFNDFESITALLQNLDLFITISNSTAHVAGGANVETWLIKPKAFALFHYWNQPENTTPWYSSITLFEQTSDPSDLTLKLNENLNQKFKD